MNHTGMKRLGEQIKKIMEHCIPELKVPSKVDIATGMNWGYTDDFKS